MWSAEQLANARTIETVGRQMGMSQRDIIIGLMTAMQESTLQSLHYGSGDSIGLFQQISSWGSVAQRENPQYAATAFFNALKGVTNRNSLSLTQAAQAVQRSAYPDAYAKWSDEAYRLLGLAGGSGAAAGIAGGLVGGSGGSGSSSVDPGMFTAGATAGATASVDPGMAVIPPVGSAPPESTGNFSTILAAAPLTDALGTPGIEEFKGPEFAAPTNFAAEAQAASMPTLPGLGAPGAPSGQGSTGLGGSDWRSKVVGIAKGLLGIPYVWGGTNPATGLDCSGFVQYVFKQLGISLPRISNQQANFGRHIALKDLQVGDLVAWDNSSRNNGADHIAIYIGNGMIIEAPRPGLSVQVSNLYDQSIAWGVRMTG